MAFINLDENDLTSLNINKIGHKKIIQACKSEIENANNSRPIVVADANTINADISFEDLLPPTTLNLPKGKSQLHTGGSRKRPYHVLQVLNLKK